MMVIIMMMMMKKIKVQKQNTASEICTDEQTKTAENIGRKEGVQEGRKERKKHCNRTLQGNFYSVVPAV